MTELELRKVRLAELLAKIEDAPREWFNPVSPMVNGQPHHAGSVEALPCRDWATCEAAMRDALYWRRDIGDAMVVLLAVCASTQQAGNQLFLDLIGSPGGCKTTLCRGLLVSGHCIHLENATKLISGYKKPGEEDKDCSFLARANGKTWVTCEFDVLANSPQYHDLMGKVRRIFDGETTATYGNDDKDHIYSALRTPWIRAGTPKMMDHDQSQLGDRFMRYILEDPPHDERRAIARRAMQLEREALVEVANCTAGSLSDPKTRRMHALTGGYVDWLRANVEELLPRVDVPAWAEDYCLDLAEFAADMRARPPEHARRRGGSEVMIESHDYKEMPTRLARQNVRLATCLAVVLNKPTVDQDVLRVMQKVALDTSAGYSLKIVGWLCKPGVGGRGDTTYQEDGGIIAGKMAPWLKMGADHLEKYLTFLRKMDVLEMGTHNWGTTWRLTERVHDLYVRIIGGVR